MYEAGTTQKADDMVEAVRRGVEAVRAKDLDGRIPVLLLDGAKVNKTMPAIAINPNKVCSPYFIPNSFDRR